MQCKRLNVWTNETCEHAKQEMKIYLIETVMQAHDIVTACTFPEILLQSFKMQQEATLSVPADYLVNLFFNYEQHEPPSN